MKLVQDSKGRFAKWNKVDLWWRPTKMTPELVLKLTEWFMMWFNDSEACLYADIAKGTLYDYINKNPEFWTKREELKKHPWIRAKTNILKSINEWDVNDSKWYLERKSRDEFSLKIETDNKTELSWNVSIDITNMTAIERLEYIKERCK